MKKVVGRPLVLAILAMLTVGAGVAQAAQFKAEAYPASINVTQGGPGAPTPPVGTGGGGGGEGEGSVLLGFEGSLMASCTSVSFTGQLTGSSSSLKTTPTVSGCAAFGFTTAIVSTNGCEFVFNAGTGSEDEFTGTMDIACPVGKKITIVGSNCEVQIGSQNGIGPIDYVNLTGEGAVTIGFESTNLAYSKTKDGFLCPLSGLGSAANGVIVGGGTLTGVGGNGIWIA